MQRIERYGVIALVFLLVTVAAVSFWGEGREPEKAPATDKVARQTEPASGAQKRPRDGRNENALESKSPVPLSPRGGVDRERPRAELAELDERESEAADREPEAPLGDAAPVIAGEEARVLDWPERISGRAARGTASGERSAEKSAGSFVNAPSIAQPPATPPKGAPRTDTAAGIVWHDVQPAETLSEIAQARLGKASRWREIQELNPGLTPETLRSGTRIKIPAGSGGAPATATVPDARTDAGRVYVVKSGDTLSGIAARELGSRERIGEILALNPGLDPDLIRLDMKLRLPAGSAPPRSLAQAPTPPAQTQQRETPRGPRVR